NIDSNTLIFSENRELDQQALSNFAGRYTWRIEVLNDFQGPLHIFQRMVTALSDFFECDRNLAAILVNGAEIAIFVQISNDRVTRQPDLFVDRTQPQLPLEVVRQCLRLSQEVFERRFFENFRLAGPRRTIVQVIIEALEIDIG